MPLVKQNLEDGLKSFFSGTLPDTAVAAASLWANAVGAYAASVIPVSTSVATATSVLNAGLSAAFQASDSLDAIESAFASFAASLAIGMADSGYAGVPPVGLVGFESLIKEDPNDYPSSLDEGAELVANLIHTWMLTGTATQGATTINWS